jgi:L,D-transpeptidase YcbB
MQIHLNRRTLLTSALALMGLNQSPSGATPGGKTTPELDALATKTESVWGRNEAPMVSMESLDAMNDAINRYEEIVAEGGWQQLDPELFKGKTKNNRYAVLRARLVRENYLPVEALALERPENLDQDLIDALKQFQAHHGLAPTGRMTPAAIAEFNVPAEDRLTALSENLPRIRAHLAGLQDRAILVNIPSAQLETVEFGQVHARHNVVVGKQERPTPSLKSTVTDVTFNPYWNAPASIVARDIIPKFLDDPTYLEQMQIQVFDGVGGPEVDPLTIDWENTPPDRYHFRQKPGDHNALATVKINFKNEFMVYIHDTPHRELFATNRRFESSGCVRVDQVRSFTSWILDGQSGFDETQFEMIAAAQQTEVIPVSNPPDVRFMYLTAWVTADGRTNFRHDIYNLANTGFVIGQPQPLDIAQNL